MQLTCPSCDSRFVVDAEHIGSAGRKVRCGQCSHQWRALPGDSDDSGQAVEAKADKDSKAKADKDSKAKADKGSEAEADGGSEAEADGGSEAEAGPGSGSEADPKAQLAAFDEARRRSRSERKPKAAEAKLPAGAVGWVIFAAVVTGLAAAAVFARQQLVAWAPGAANIYALVGLPVEMPPSARALSLSDVTLDRRLVDGQQTLVIVGAIVNATEEDQPVPPLVAKLIDPEGVEIERWTFEAEVDMLPARGTTRFENRTANPPKQIKLDLNFAVTDPQ